MTSDYEKHRLELIEKNKAKLASLQLKSIIPKKEITETTQHKHKRKKECQTPTDTQTVRPIRKASLKVRGIDIKDFKTFQDDDENNDLSISENVHLNKNNDYSNVKEIIHSGPVHISDPEFFDAIKSSESYIKEERKSFDGDNCFLDMRVLPENVVKLTKSRIYSIAAHENSSLIVAGDKKGSIGFWFRSLFSSDSENNVEIEGDQKIFSFQPHTDSIPVLTINNDKLISVSYDGTLRVMDMKQNCRPKNNVAFDLVGSLPKESNSTFSWMDFNEKCNTLLLSTMSGFVLDGDFRVPFKNYSSYKLHHKKIGCVSIDPFNTNVFVTSSLDRTVAIWDRRNLSSCSMLSRIENDEFELPPSLSSWPHKNAVTSAFFSPNKSGRLLTTCYDNFLRFYDLSGHVIKSDVKEERHYKSETIATNAFKAFPHNNQTGAWISVFRGIFDPFQRGNSINSEHDRIVIGNMDKSIDCFTWTNEIDVAHTCFHSDIVTAQPAINSWHPTQEIIISGNATGKISLWTPRSKQ